MARISEMHKKWMAEPGYRKAYDALEKEFALALSSVSSKQLIPDC